jgi:hypothetical protein
MAEIAKELLSKGACGVQTLYMTGRMKKDRKTRAPANRCAVLLRVLD